MQRRPGGVLEGIADRIADDRSFMGVGFLAAVLAGFDPLLGVVPGSSAVVHEHGQQHAGDGADHEQSGYCRGSAEVDGDAVDGGDEAQGSGKKRCTRAVAGAEVAEDEADGYRQTYCENAGQHHLLP